MHAHAWQSADAGWPRYTAGLVQPETHAVTAIVHGGHHAGTQHLHLQCRSLAPHDRCCLIPRQADQLWPRSLGHAVNCAAWQAALFWQVVPRRLQPSPCSSCPKTLLPLSTYHCTTPVGAGGQPSSPMPWSAKPAELLAPAAPAGSPLAVPMTAALSPRGTRSRAASCPLPLSLLLSNRVTARAATTTTTRRSVVCCLSAATASARRMSADTEPGNTSRDGSLHVLDFQIIALPHTASMARRCGVASPAVRQTLCGARKKRATGVMAGPPHGCIAQMSGVPQRMCRGGASHSAV
jgi:hypothetical protein